MMPLTGGPLLNTPHPHTSALYIQLIHVPLTRRSPQSANVRITTFEWNDLSVDPLETGN